MDALTLHCVHRANSLLRLATTIALVALLSLCFGCASTVHFDSEPTGAYVSYKGEVVGITPFDYNVWDSFGWFSVYTFLAWKPGYAPVVQTVQEPLPAAAQYILQPGITFKLTPVPK